MIIGAIKTIILIHYLIFKQNYFSYYLELFIHFLDEILLYKFIYEQELAIWIWLNFTNLLDTIKVKIRLPNL